MHKYQRKESRTMKNRVNVTTLKETKKALITLKKWRSMNCQRIQNNPLKEV